MEYIASLGPVALGSRLKALSDHLYDAADAVYRAHGSPMQARWLPVLRRLLERGPGTVGEIAREIGQTHSAVSQLAAKLVRAGWLQAEGDREDRRRRVLALTPKAEAELKALRPVWRAVAETMGQTIAETGLDFLAALQGLEARLAARPVADRILERIQADARRRLRIVAWDPALAGDFYRLNAEWLQKHFYLEQVDHEVLSQPERMIIAPGGQIFFALLDEEVVGTCALLQESPGVFELTKMAVTERHQGLGIGRRLLQAAIDHFRARGGRELFLESNSKLANALRLYASMGFELQPTIRPGSHYQRADVYMIWRDAAAAEKRGVSVEE